MAEIKSTMEMVMERAARMAEQSTQDSTDEDTEKIGMRLAAEHLKTGENSLLDVLQQQEKEKRLPILKGMADTLLRNIVLPRDGVLLETGERALQAITDLSAGQLSSVCTEIQQILGQYNQHKDQMVQQLEDAIRSQIEQQMAQQGERVGENISINPATHPQYQEELMKMTTGLNDQYNNALDERKAMIRGQLTSIL